MPLTFDTVKKSGKYVVTGVAASGAMLASQASYALDAAVTSAITTQLAATQADGLEIAALIWPVVVILAGASIGFKLFKRFVSKV